GDGNMNVKIPLCGFALLPDFKAALTAIGTHDHSIVKEAATIRYRNSISCFFAKNLDTMPGFVGVKMRESFGDVGLVIEVHCRSSRDHRLSIATYGLSDSPT